MNREVVTLEKGESNHLVKLNLRDENDVSKDPLILGSRRPRNSFFLGKDGFTPFFLFIYV